MKKIITVLTFTFLCSAVFAKGGLLAGTGKTKYIQTKWFDIIYPEESRESAMRIASICDELYEKLCAEYSSPELEKKEIGKPQFRMPVVITPQREAFNAYYSNYTFNHIVLYDTLPEESGSVSSNELENTFLHELTHAVSFNTTTPSVRNLMNIFGDTFNIGGFLVPTTFISEGATVAEESKEGEGRLNDGFFLHTIRQAKADGTFPDYSDVTGSRDIFPYSSDGYMFGGPFAEYLQQTYGMQKYAEFWYEAISRLHISYRGAFKDAYGFTIDKAWEEFKASIKIPDVKQHVLEEEGTEDFLKTTESSVGNFKGHRFTNFCMTEKGFYFLDECTSTVYFCKKSGSTYLKAEKLFTKTNITSLGASRDGRYLTVNFYSVNHIAAKSKLCIYDTQKKSFYKVNGTGLKSACIIKKDDTYILAAVENIKQDFSIKIYSLDEKMNASPVKEVKLPFDCQAFSPCDAGNGNLTFILKDASVWNVGILNVFYSNEKPEISKVPLPEKNIRIRNLASGLNENEFTFCYVKKETFPRFGKLVLNKESSGLYKADFFLSTKDINGGIYFPVDAGNGKIIYSSYDITSYNLISVEQKVLEINAAASVMQSADVKNAAGAKAVMENPVVTGAVMEGDDINTDAVKNGGDFLKTAEKNYNAPYHLRGLFVPLATVTAFNLINSGRTSVMAAETSALLGATYIMTNPWGSDNLTLSAGYDAFNKMGGASVTFSGNADTSVYSYNNQISAVFYDGGFLQETNLFTFTSAFRLGNYSSIGFTEYNGFFFGKIYELNSDENIFVKSPRIVFDDFHWYDENIVSAEFSTIHKTGSGTFESSGFSVSANYQTVLCGTVSDKKISLYDLNSTADYLFKEKNFYQNLYPEVTVRLSHLLPLECSYGYTYNFPLSITASLLPDYGTFLYAQASIVLFAKEIQKGLSFMPLYFNRFFIRSGFIHQTTNSNSSFEILNLQNDFNEFSSMTHKQIIFASLNLQGKYNSGMACNVLHDLGIIFTYNIQTKKPAFSISYKYDIGGI